MKKVLVFLDELYFKKDKQYISKFNAGRFLTNLDMTFSLNFTVPVCDESPINPTTIINEDNVIPLPCWNSLADYLKRFWKINRIIKETLSNHISRADKVWIRMPSLPGLYIAFIAFRLNKCCVLHFAGDIRYGYQSEQYRGLQKIIAFIIGFTIHYITKITVFLNRKHIYSLCTGSKLLKQFSASRSTFFIDSETDSSNLQKKINNEILKIVFVGKLTKSKGVSVLLEAIGKIENIQVYIVGYGTLENEILLYCGKIKYLHYLGFKTGIELNNIYSMADILVMPSINNTEGFPRVIIEAWNNRLAVISTDVGGIKGVGRHDENILFVKTNNAEDLKKAIFRLNNDRVLLEKLKNNGYKTSRILSKDHMLSIAKESLEQV